MDALRLQANEMTHTMKKYGKFDMPNTSAPMSTGASMVLVALPNTAAYPSAAVSCTGKPTIPDSSTPSVAPMENSGVTSPP